MLPLPTCAVLLLLLAGGALPAWSADACRPLRSLPPNTPVTFSTQEFELLPRLQVVAGQPLLLNASPAVFGLRVAGESRLPNAVAAPPQVVGHGVLGVEGAKLLFDRSHTRTADTGPVGGRIHLHAGARRYVVHVTNGEARSADGTLLELVPPLASVSPFRIGAGAPVTPVAAGLVRIGAGARLEWSPDSGSGELEAILTKGVRLEQAAPPGSHSQIEILKTRRVLAGAPLRVKLTAPGFDFGSKVVAFCFGAPDGAAGMRAALPTVAARLVERVGDAAVYDVPVPEELSAALVPRDSLGTDWLRGRDAQLRVIGYDAGEVVVDASSRFTVSSTTAAILAGLVLLVLAFLGAAMFVGSVNPLMTLAQLVRRPDGAYSLSNVQILLWTLLVIFALCFVWVGSGQLLSISPGILVLLGISGGSSVLARAIEKGDAGGSPREGSVADLLSDGEGRFDLLRFQMLGFTVFAWLYSLVSVLRFDGLPEIPESLYLLMGISNAAYLGGKIAPRIAAHTAGDGASASTGHVTDAERALGNDAIRKLQGAIGAPPTGQLDEATRTAVSNYKRQNGITPANGRVNRLLLKSLSLA